MVYVEDRGCEFGGYGVLIFMSFGKVLDGYDLRWYTQFVSFEVRIILIIERFTLLDNYERSSEFIFNLAWPQLFPNSTMRIYSNQLQQDLSTPNPPFLGKPVLETSSRIPELSR